MKKWIGILVFLIALLVIAYYPMGMMVESTLNKNINAFPKNPIMVMKLENYQRGWFGSEAILRIKMHIPEQTTTDSSGNKNNGKPVDFELSYPLIIHHGPIICSYSGIRFGIGQVSTNPETHYGVLINYLNKTIIRYAFPSFALQAKVVPAEENFQFEWKGINSLFSVSSNVDKIDGNFDFLGLQGAAKNVRFDIEGVFNDFNLKRIKEGLWVGHYHLDVPLINASMPDNKPFSLEGFDYQIASNVQENSFNLNLDLSLKKLQVMGNDYGPGALKLSIRNLDANAIAEVNQKGMNLMANGGGSELNALALFFDLPKLLTQGPEIEVSALNFNLPDGQINGHFKVNLAKSDDLDPNQIMKNTKGDGQLKAPIKVVKALMLSTIKDKLQKQQATPQGNTPTGTDTGPNSAVQATQAPVDIDAEAQKQLDALLEKLISKGYLKVEGNDYIIQFNLENEKLKINGQDLDPSTFQ